MGRQERTSSVGDRDSSDPGDGLDVGDFGVDTPLLVLQFLKPWTEVELEKRESCSGSWKRV
jgi:hypothetical protein